MTKTIEIPRTWDGQTDVDAENQARNLATLDGFYVTNVPSGPTYNRSSKSWTVTLEGHEIEAPEVSFMNVDREVVQYGPKDLWMSIVKCSTVKQARQVAYALNQVRDNGSVF